MNKSIPSVAGHGIGRRKSSVARVWLKPGTGKIEVNGIEFSEYFSAAITQATVSLPFKVCGTERAFNAKISVNGGGIVGQAGAVQLGIARALLDANEMNKASLRQNDLLTVDSRVKERKKYGQKAARRRFQFVKR